MSIMKIIDMPVMLNGGVSTSLAVNVGVIIMFLTVCHDSSPVIL